MLNRSFRLFAVVVLVAGLLAPLSWAGDIKVKEVQPQTGHAHHEMFDKCAKACNDCQRICDACSTHCTELVAKGKKEHLQTQKTCQDCASFCATAAQIVSRGGPFADLICKSCADACNRCGKACEQLKGDQMMQRCADECFRCEKACQQMLQHLGQQKGKDNGKGVDKGDTQDRAGTN